MQAIDPLRVLRAFVAHHPNQRTAATALGISQAYLSDLLNARRHLSEKLLAKLGLRQIVVKSFRGGDLK